MRRWIAGLALVLACASAWAQAFDPTIAYTRGERNGMAIYLANADGSRATSVFSAKASLSEVDIAPGGGRVAFSQGGILKVLSYRALPSGIAVDGVATLVPSRARGPDFSPDGNSILYIVDLPTSTEVRAIGANGGTLRVLSGDLPGLTHVAWLGSDRRYVYLRQLESDLRQEVHLVELDEFDNILLDTVLLTTDGALDFLAIEDLDAARTKDAVVVTLADPFGLRVATYDLGSRQLTYRATGSNGHFSANDGAIVYLNANREHIERVDLTTGAVTRLTTRKIDLTSVDARP